VLAAAARRFARDGYHAVTVEDLLREAGVSRTLFYKHFDGREDVLAELYRISIQRLRDQVLEALGDATDLAQILERGIPCYFAAVAAAGPLGIELMRLQYGSERLHAIRERVVADFIAAVSARLARGRRPAVPDVLIDAVLAGVDRIAERMMASGTVPTIEALRPAWRALARRAFGERRRRPDASG
jgi:AcrR family transcriptional regulator